MMMRPAEFWGEKKGSIWVGVGDGKTPILGSQQNPSPDPRLPALDFNPEHRKPYVFRAPTIVSISADNYFLVPCNGETAHEVTYTANDIQPTYTVKNPTLTGPVTAGSKYTFAANKPVGWLVWDVLGNPICTPNNFKTDLTQQAPTVFTEGYVYLPIVYKTAEVAGTCKNYAFQAGDLICADGTPSADSPTAYVGGIRKWAEGVDKIDQIVGRIEKVENEYQFDKQGLNYLRSDGADIQSDATQGFPRHIWNGFKDVDTSTFTRQVVWVLIDM